ncbi:hypothetical protein AB0G49_14265 [Streptomyces longwoodensis]|uniref:hypothetical protein n=1 Tax=Streptomyces longwoodensis TaxID=68231 RepID=UPI0033CC6178
MSRQAAADALTEYAQLVGKSESTEPEHWQASDLITDLLLGFDPPTADLILHRVTRDLDAERAEEPPLFPPAD